MAENEVATREALKAHRDAIGNLVEQNAGRVVDAVGDNLLAEFPSVVYALECAIKIQRDVDERNQKIIGESRLRFRIGINVGDIMDEGQAIAGDAINVAARLESLAETGGICISDSVYDQVKGKLTLRFKDLGEKKLHNIPKPIRVYSVLIPSDAQNSYSRRKEKKSEGDIGPHPRGTVYKIPLLAQVTILSLLVGFAISVVRPILQTWELKAFDHLMRLRQGEEQDSRLLIVSVAEEDLKYQDEMGLERGAASLSDEALARVLVKLNTYQPRVIGLDIYRDFPVNPRFPHLETQLKQNDHLIAACFIGGSETNHYGIAPPPEIPVEARIGFSNFPKDSDDTVRRHLLGMSKDEKSACQTQQSFSLRLVLAYLAGEKQPLTIHLGPEGQDHIANLALTQLDTQAGGYQLPDSEVRGYQILLNYRSADPLSRQVSLKEILDGSLDSQLPTLVNDRIVLIGTTSTSSTDLHSTPYSTGKWPKKTPGVEVHAHMVSQLLSAIFDDRPLLWWWSQRVETIWVVFWSIVGGLLASLFRSSFFLAPMLTAIAAPGLLYGLCFLFLTLGGWIPLVPSAIALVLTFGAALFYSRLFTRRLQ